MAPYRPAPGQISEAIERAFRRSFHPSRDHLCCGVRPSAANWAMLLRELHGQIVPCTRNPHHHHPQGVACLWCAVDQAAGHPISRFPTGRRKPGSPDPAPPSAPQPLPLPQEWLNQLQPVEARLRRGLSLRQNHGELVDRLLELSQSIDRLKGTYGEAAQMLDRDALLQSLRPTRRTWRQWLLRRPAPTEPQEELETLIRGAEAIARGVHSAVVTLQKQQYQLLEALAQINLAELEQHLPDVVAHPSPAAWLSSPVQQQIAGQRQDWLRRQLQAIPLRTLAEDSVAEGRLAILEANGIHNAQELQRRLDGITSLHGIGSVTQMRLRQRLEVVEGELRQRDTTTTPTSGVDLQALLQTAGMASLPAYHTLEQQLATVQQQLTSLEQTFRDLQMAVIAQVEEQSRQVIALQQRFA